MALATLPGARAGRSRSLASAPRRKTMRSGDELAQWPLEKLVQMGQRSVVDRSSMKPL
jgi:hypothetical protein